MTSNSSSWSAPPEGILLRILSLVDTQPRLKAALVNPHWAAAAAAATRSIRFTPRHTAAVDTLHQYLSKHGQHVTRLVYETYWSIGCSIGPLFLLKQLPCPNLQEFEFIGVGAQLLPDSSAPHLLQAATGLTQLIFDLAGFVPLSGACLSMLTDLTQLQSLKVTKHRTFNELGGEAEPQSALDGAVLRELTRLTQLKLLGSISISTLRYVSCLTGLQDLVIKLHFPVVEAVDSSVQQDHTPPQLQHLTKLQLGAPGLPINSSTYPWLAELPALLHAEYAEGVLEPQVIIAGTQLTYLRVHWTVAEIIGESSGLLALVSSLRSLQQLEVCDFNMYGSSCDVLFPNACSSLTAGSRLVSLSLSGWGFPQGGWQHVFPAGVQLGLTHLELRDATGKLINTEDLQRLVQCCPHLKRLCLLPAVEHGVPLQALVQLSGLEALVISGLLSQDADDRAVEWRNTMLTLAQLPALDELSIASPDVLSRTEMLQLTVLTRLTWLQLNMEDNQECLLVKEDEEDDDDVGQAEVWHRLLLSSLGDAACRDVLLQQEAAVQQQLQQAGQDPRPVQLALQEARMREDLSKVQRRLERKLDDYKIAGYW